MAASLLFPVSSTSADELRRTAGWLADWVRVHDDVALPDLAYTLARRRAHRPVRTAVNASSQPELTAALREVAEGDIPYEAAVGRDDRGSGVGVLRPGFAVGGDGRAAAGDRTDVCGYCRASRASDRSRCRRRRS